MNDKIKKTSAHILTPYKRSIHLVLRHKEWLVEDVPFYPNFWAKLTHPPLRKRQFSIDIRSQSLVLKILGIYIIYISYYKIFTDSSVSLIFWLISRLVA